MKKMNNQAKLKHLGLEGKERYYYLRFGTGAEIPDGFLGVATICLLPVPACDGNTILRGIAFCSPPDQFNKKVGRAIALGRAVKALERGDDNEVAPRKVAGILSSNYMTFLSAFNPELTDFERTLVSYENKEGENAKD